MTDATTADTWTCIGNDIWHADHSGSTLCLMPTLHHGFSTGRRVTTLNATWRISVRGRVNAEWVSESFDAAKLRAVEIANRTDGFQ